MEILEQKAYLQSLTPFNSLKKDELDEICRKLDIVYFKKDEEIIGLQSSEHFLYFIIKGSVQEQEPISKEVASLYHKNEFFDAISLIEHRVKNIFITLEETICYSLPKETFLKILYQNPTIEHFFFQSISQKLGLNLQDNQNRELANFMVARVGDAYLQKPHTIKSNTAIYDAVLFMKENSISSVLIDDEQRGLGIATDTDFREKVILNRLDFSTPVIEISTFGLKEIKIDDFLFNAQLLMTRHKIKRLIVKDKEGCVCGVIDQMSIASFFSSHTYAVANEIDKANTLEELKSASGNFIRIVRALYAKGVKARYISKLLNELNKKLFEKVFLFLAPKEIRESSTLIVMGSEGRYEQILRTDQDNALILSDEVDIDEKIIEEFRERFSDTLCDFGYPRCQGNIMVSNPYWCKKRSEYIKEIDRWIAKKDEQDFLNLAIFIDASSVAGDSSLLESVKNHLYKKVEKDTAFFSSFGSLALFFGTPLGLFNDFKLGKKEHKKELDIKKGGIFPIVQGVRVLALEQKIVETNTVDRVKELNNLGILDKEFASEIIETFNLLVTIRLKSQLEKLDKDQETNNYINPDELTTMDKDLLKDALKIVNRFKKFLTSRYRLEYTR